MEDSQDRLTFNKAANVTDAFSINLVFAWYGFSLVLFLFIVVEFVEKGRLSKRSTDKHEGRVGFVERLVLLLIGLVGVWGLATLLGEYKAAEYANQFLILGLLLGSVASNRIIGRPTLRLKMPKR